MCVGSCVGTRPGRFRDVCGVTCGDTPGTCMQTCMVSGVGTRPGRAQDLLEDVCADTPNTHTGHVWGHVAMHPGHAWDVRGGRMCPRRAWGQYPGTPGRGQGRARGGKPGSRQGKLAGGGIRALPAQAELTVAAYTTGRAALQPQRPTAHPAASAPLPAQAAQVRGLLRSAGRAGTCAGASTWEVSNETRPCMCPPSPSPRNGSKARNWASGSPPQKWTVSSLHRLPLPLSWWLAVRPPGERLRKGRCSRKQGHLGPPGQGRVEAAWSWRTSWVSRAPSGAAGPRVGGPELSVSAGAAAAGEGPSSWECAGGVACEDRTSEGCSLCGTVLCMEAWRHLPVVLGTGPSLRV